MDSTRFRPGRLLQAACLLILLMSGCDFRRQTEPDRLSLVALLKEGQFAALESELVRYQLRFEADQEKPDNQWPVYKAFFAFADSDPELQSRLNEWVAAMPDSYAAHLARGMFYEHLGWLSRGEAFAGETAKERFADMNRFFALAKPDLQEALTINPRLLDAYASKARTERASGNRKLMELALTAGLGVTPEAVPLHLTFIDGLEPRWGGTLAETRAYLQFLARRYPKIAALKWFGGYEDYVEGYELLTAERYDEALARFDRALSFDDQYPYYHYGRALALYMLARDSEAAQTLEPALAADPRMLTERSDDLLNPRPLPRRSRSGAACDAACPGLFARLAAIHRGALHDAGLPGETGLAGIPCRLQRRRHVRRRGKEDHSGRHSDDAVSGVKRGSGLG